MNFGTLLILLYNSSKMTDVRTLWQHVIQVTIHPKSLNYKLQSVKQWDVHIGKASNSKMSTSVQMTYFFVAFHISSWSLPALEKFI